VRRLRLANVETVVGALFTARQSIIIDRTE
jgi:hypothetical protein